MLNIRRETIENMISSIDKEADTLHKENVIALKAESYGLKKVSGLFKEVLRNEKINSFSSDTFHKIDIFLEDEIRDRKNPVINKSNYFSCLIATEKEINHFNENYYVGLLHGRKYIEALFITEIKRNEEIKQHQKQGLRR